jgi:hypothetical protein
MKCKNCGKKLCRNSYAIRGCKMRIGTIKRKKCKITGRLIKMYFTDDFKSERGDNGHKGWICLHRG